MMYWITWVLWLYSHSKIFVHHFVFIQQFLGDWILCEYELVVQWNFVIWFIHSDTECFASRRMASYCSKLNICPFDMFLDFVLLVGSKIRMCQIEVSWFDLCKSKHPKNKSYETLVTHHSDKFVPLRMEFLKYLAKMLKSFLLQF